MNRLTGNLKIHFMNLPYFFLVNIFFIVPFLLMFLFFAITSDPAGKVTFVGIVTAAIGIYAIILGAFTPSQVMPYAISMGSTRRDYYISTIAFYTMTGALFSILQVILFIIEGMVFKSLGWTQLNNYEFIFHNISFAGTLRLALFHFGVLMVIAGFFNLLGSMYYKLGKKFWLVILLSIVFIYNIDVLKEGAAFLFTGTDYIMDLKNILNAALTFFLGWLFIRKAEVKR